MKHTAFFIYQLFCSANAYGLDNCCALIIKRLKNVSEKQVLEQHVQHYKIKEKAVVAMHLAPVAREGVQTNCYRHSEDNVPIGPLMSGYRKPE